MIHNMEEKQGEEVQPVVVDPLTKIYLPLKISSSHTCCKTLDENNNVPETSPQLLETDIREDMSIDEKVELALAYFEKGEYERAWELFKSLSDSSVVAKYYVSILLYDGIGATEDHARAVSLMKEVVASSVSNHEKLIHCAEYNIGRAYYEGFGVKQSDEEAEKW